MKGFFPHFILREADLYLKLSKKNPNLTIEELALHEEELNMAREKAKKALNTDANKAGAD